MSRDTCPPQGLDYSEQSLALFLGPRSEAAASDRQLVRTLISVGQGGEALCNGHFMQVERDFFFFRSSPWACSPKE